MDQRSNDEFSQIFSDGMAVLSKSQSHVQQEGALPPLKEEAKNSFSPTGQIQKRLNEHNGEQVDEELLRGIIHEMGTALTIIRLHADILERTISKKIACLSPLQVVEQRLDQEEDSVQAIVRQVQYVESLMTTIANGAS